MKKEENFEDVLNECQKLKEAVKEIGCPLEDPFMTAAFMSLSVIPSLKITDKGVYDVCKSEFTDIFDV